MKKAVKELLAEARSAGWRVVRHNGKHWVLRHRDGVRQTNLSTTPSDKRGLLNKRKELGI